MGEPLMRRLTPLALVATLGLGSAQGNDKPADKVSDKSPDKDGARCLVRAIEAAPTGQFDERLAPLRPQLSKAPFSAWKGQRLLEQQELTLKKDSPAKFPVPGEHGGVLTYRGPVEGSKKRLRLHLELTDASARLLSTVFVINDGGTMLHVGIRHGTGTLVLGITCKLSD